VLSSHAPLCKTCGVFRPDRLVNDLNDKLQRCGMATSCKPHLASLCQPARTPASRGSWPQPGPGSPSTTASSTCSEVTRGDILCVMGTRMCVLDVSVLHASAASHCNVSDGRLRPRTQCHQKSHLTACYCDACYGFALFSVETEKHGRPGYMLPHRPGSVPGHGWRLSR
jgi:hypothetical protein